MKMKILHPDLKLVIWLFFAKIFGRRDAKWEATAEEWNKDHRTKAYKLGGSIYFDAPIRMNNPP